MTVLARTLALALVFAACSNSKSESEPAPDPQTQPDPEPEPALVSVTWPAGDADKGRQVFIDNKCFKCHMVLIDDELMAMHEKAEKMATAPHDKMVHKGHGADSGMAHPPGHTDPGGAHPSGHNKPPPLNAATLGKPPLILVKQMVIPGDIKADHHAHYGTYADKLTLAGVTHLAAFFRKVAKTLDNKPEAMPPEDLDLLWPKGDATAGNAVIAERCNVCHGEGTPKLAVTQRARLVTVWQIAIAAEHEPMLEKLTLRQVSDVVEAVTTSSP